MERKVSTQLHSKLAVETLITMAVREEIPLRSWEGMQSRPQATSTFVRNMQQLDELDEQLTMYEERLLQLEVNQEVLKRQHQGLCEQRDVLVELSLILDNTDFRLAAVASVAGSPTVDGWASSEHKEDGEGGARSLEDSPASRSSLLGESSTRHRRAHHAASLTSGTSFVAGVVPLAKAQAFERVMWRALRGNIFMRIQALPDIEEPHQRTGAHSKDKADSADRQRSAFIIFCHGKETTERIRRMSVALGCRLADVPEEQSARSERFKNLISRIDDIHSILFNSRQALRSELSKVAEWLEAWLVGVRRDKAVFSTLNQLSLDAGKRGLVGEAWVPSSALPAIDAAVQRASAAAGLYADIPTLITSLPITQVTEPVPTYFPLNKFTAAFQEITDAYGIPAYRELNPALFMLASFPLLFAVMFGDMGHGVIMLVAGLFLVAFERRLAAKAAREEMFGMVFSGRYLVVSMGLASIFVGLVYNDCFSRSLRLFPSAYTLDRVTGVVTRNKGRVYPVGLDPIWARAENGMTLTNSYKMKQSILLGVAQMTFGLVLSAVNRAAEGDLVAVYGTFLPQLIFFLSLFGYLGALIIIKWIWPRDVSLIVVFINMVLGFGKVEGEALFKGQALLQKLLIALAILSIPWMFLGKPLYMLYGRMRICMAGYRRASLVSDDRAENPEETKANGPTPSATHSQAKSGPSRSPEEQGREKGGEESLGDVFMLQMIHTIEFALGSVSNTASYLRLWALSLAHVQLSDVLWDMVLIGTVFHPIALFLGFAAWFGLSVGIMVAMEGMSVFLHALRLHWVEFNGKFYRGTGVKFTPLDTTDRHILAQLVEEHVLG